MQPKARSRKHEPTRSKVRLSTIEERLRGFAAAFVRGGDVVYGAFSLDEFVDTLASRISLFDKLAIGDTKRLVNAASLPPDVEVDAGWQVCMASITRPAAQKKIKALMALGFHKPGDLEERIGYYVGKPAV